MSSPARPAFDPRNLLIKSPQWTPGYALIASPQTSPLRWITFARLILNADAPRYEASTGSQELVIDLHAGCCRAEVQAGSAPSVFELGPRRDVFAADSHMLFVPPGCAFSLECAAGEAVLALFSAPAGTPAAAPVPRHVAPGQALAQMVGRDNWTRRVVTPVGENVAAERLILGETTNPPGNWSSAPPHKHDRSRPPAEAVMEEVYYFQVQPEQGFGFMRVYTGADDPEPFDEAFVVEHGDTVLIPRGYHPVVAGPGYRLNYTWALAGEERRYGAWSDDPRHSWIKK